MNCSYCSYYYADRNCSGEPVSKPYCHYSYDDDYAPCAIDDNETSYNETED